jgi:hypothetical protein
MTPAAALAGRSSVVIGRRYGALLSKRDLNSLVRVSLGRALWAWIDTFLPKRWDSGYARRLGYSGRGRTPFFKKGTFLRSAVGARPIVTAKGGGAVGRITVPIGHPMRPGEMASFRVVPPAEARFVAIEMLRAARAVIADSPPPQAVGGARGQAKLRQRLAADAAAEAGKYGGRNNHWGFNADRNERLWAIGQRNQGMRQAGHRRGIAQGDAAAPGSQEPALGRAVTQAGANARYRRSDRGRRTRAQQHRRARARDRDMVRAGVRADPSRYHRNTRRAFGLA